MLIATFGPSTGWAGKTITREGEAFILEGHGPISAADVMEYDRQGHLVWANDGTRAWLGSKVHASPKRQPSVPAPTGTPSAPSAAPAATADTGQDRVGLWLRNLGRTADFRLGAIAGAATLCITWLGTFFLGLIPIRFLDIALLSPGSGARDPLNYHWWAAWSLLGHFGGRAWVELGANASDTEFNQGAYSVNLTGLLPLAIFVGVMLLVGIYVKELASNNLRARLTVVIVAAATVAVVVGVVALLGGFAIGKDGGDYTVGFGVFSSFLRAFVITSVVGAFAFGVVELFPVPHAAALQNAARFAIIPILVVALVAPLVVGAKLSDSAGSIDRDFIAVGSLVAPAAAAAIVPLSFGSQATYGVIGSDFKGRDTPGGGDISARTVNSLLTSFYGGRVFELAGRLGLKVKFGAFVLVVAVLAFWAYTVRRYLRTMGAPTGIEGLKTGAYLGLVCGLAVVLLALLLTLNVSFAESSLAEDTASVATVRAAVGITGASYPYILLVLVATGAGIGYLVGTLRPSPIRYVLSDSCGLLVRRAKTALSEQIKPTGRQAAETIEAPVAFATPGTEGDITPRSLAAPVTSAPPRAPSPVTAPTLTDAKSRSAAVEPPVPSPVTMAAATAPSAPTSAEPTDTSATSIGDEIAKLADLHAKGTLTDEEFAAFKAKLME